MASWNEALEQEVETLRTVRDELRVQIHLGAAEARDRWEKAERDFAHLEGRLKQIQRGSQESLEDIGEAARLLVEQIRAGYEHVKNLL